VSRSRTFAILDLAFAALHGWIGFAVAPSRAVAFQVALAIVIALELAAGVGLLVGARWARSVGIAMSVVLLAFAGVVLLLLVASAAYLRGVYGALGQGMAVLSLVAAALAVQLFALVPFFQLRFLLARSAAPAANAK
jgi:hypothetical protein